LQEVALGRVLGACDRGLVRQCRLGVAAEASEQIGADGVEQVVAAEITAVEPFHEGERRIRSLDLGHRDRAVEGYDRARGEDEELVVQLQDLPPVCGGRSWGVAVDGVDRRLDLVRPGLVALETLADNGLAFVDEIAVPSAASPSGW
jgi:hypothetical protein